MPRIKEKIRTYEDWITAAEFYYGEEAADKLKSFLAKHYIKENEKVTELDINLFNILTR